MSRIKYKESVFYPENIVTIQYEGDRPFGFYNDLPDIIKTVFRVETKDIRELRLDWDTSGKNVGFFNLWIIDTRKDNYTAVFAILQIKGSMDPATKKGSATINCIAWLQTEFDYATPIHHILGYMYWYLFYKKIRMNYLQESKETILNFIDNIRAKLGVSMMSFGTDSEVDYENIGRIGKIK